MPLHDPAPTGAPYITAGSFTAQPLRLHQELAVVDAQLAPRPPRGLDDIPADLRRRFAGGELGTCDWGHCDRPQTGWATCADPDCPRDPGWVAICHRCAKGILPPVGRMPDGGTWHPVGELITFADIRAAYEADRNSDDAQPDEDLTHAELALGALLGSGGILGLYLAAQILADWIA